MKNLILEYKNASQHLLNGKKVIWSLYSRRARIMPGIFGIVGVIFLYGSFNANYNLEKISSIEFYSNGIHIGIGIALLLFSLFSINSYYQLKNRSQDLFERRIKSYQKNGDKLVYTFSEIGISLENHDTKRHTYWEYYSGYKLKEDFVFIFSKFQDTRVPYEIIPLEPLDRDLVENLKMLLKEKLYERR